MDRKLKYEMWEKQERHVTIELMANQIFPYFEKKKQNYLCVLDSFLAIMRLD